jgi:hypothetical protein
MILVVLARLAVLPVIVFLEAEKFGFAQMEILGFKVLPTQGHNAVDHVIDSGVDPVDPVCVMGAIGIRLRVSSFVLSTL